MGIVIAGVFGVIVVTVIVLLYLGIIGTGYAAKKGVDHLGDDDDPRGNDPRGTS